MTETAHQRKERERKARRFLGLSRWREVLDDAIAGLETGQQMVIDLESEGKVTAMICKFNEVRFLDRELQKEVYGPEATSPYSFLDWFRAPYQVVIRKAEERVDVIKRRIEDIPSDPEIDSILGDE